ncbi:uncharacterized protein N0V89_007876 [Didymosphaeria variabile]|uniref:Zinc finger PHD-type domain-containing protein n=1 Tax=Didymosphaeria variabile TaxID=1932322 RepID=A0A9W9CAW2_9PLEO|nr:uncharacterized protein N0V89_007876 [Didymosphaeria variabile]KAJ4352527.1 hypothetical protein N0V89_007876 [Didymosphaeria variabile]
MFMRNRGHTCDMCMHIDEHHYKRHHEMCEQIRCIYETCGEDWPIIPEDEDGRGRARFRDPDTHGSDDLSSASGEVPLKKRERKEQKRQMRAASRSKVVTQDDINYVDSVLHPAASQVGTGNPDNPEEIEEIEKHLKYNAQCYNDGQKRSDIRLYAHIPDADIDFGAEINRIFELLHIAELLKRKERNRGLRNKELSNFKTLVSEFKDLLITDLVQAKRDELEIRMRRAAFLRYTNRASFDIMANRYADKDWKTGQKYQSAGSASASSDSLTAVEEEEEIDSDDLATPDDLRHLSSATLHDADRRHIEHSHKKIGSSVILEPVVAVQESKDPPKEGAPKPPPSLRIVNTDIIPPAKVKFHNPWKHRNMSRPFETLKRSAQSPSSSELLSGGPAPDEDDGWQTVGPVTIPTRASGKQSDASRSISRASVAAPEDSAPGATPKARSLSLKPMRVGVIASMYQDEAERHQMAEKVEQDAEQAYVQSVLIKVASANCLTRRQDAKTRVQERKEQLQLAEAHLQLQTEEMLLQKLEESTEVAKSPDVEQPAVESRKKKDKKKQRETDRKARRAAEKEPGASKQIDELLGDTDVASPSSDVSALYNVLAKGLVDEADRALQSPRGQGSSSKVAGAHTTDDLSGAHLELSRDALKEGIQRSRRTMHAKDATSLDSWLHSISSLLEVPPPSKDQAPELGDQMLTGSILNDPVADSVTTPKRESRHSEPAERASPSAPLSTSKIGRHKDWMKFAGSLKVDSLSKLLFTAMHPAYQEHADDLYIGGCPWEASGTPDCPYHKTYCPCIDPVDPTNDKYIVYAETYPYQIGPFNCIQAAKLMHFFESQPETKGRLMLVDEDLYLWLYTEGRHWLVEAMTPKQMENSSFPRRLYWEVKDYVRGYAKGRVLKLVEQFQDLADKNERSRTIGCRATISEELLESLRKKCETRPDNKAICYCKDNMPAHPETDDNVVRCMYVDCPIGFFHRRCVEKLGHAKVSTWYCAFCEKYMNVAAQKALHGADAIHKGLPAPDFTDGKYGAQLRCVAAGIDMMKTGHCEGH